jgi:hypothetical protein
MTLLADDVQGAVEADILRAHSDSCFIQKLPHVIIAALSPFICKDTGHFGLGRAFT